MWLLMKDIDIAALFSSKEASVLCIKCLLGCFWLSEDCVSQ